MVLSPGFSLESLWELGKVLRPRQHSGSVKSESLEVGQVLGAFKPPSDSSVCPQLKTTAVEDLGEWGWGAVVERGSQEVDGIFHEVPAWRALEDAD